MGVTTLLVLLTTLTLFNGASSQYFVLPKVNEVQYYPACGLEDLNGTWRYEWRLELHPEHQAHFERIVEVVASSVTLCNIDLDACYTRDNESSFDNICYCLKNSGHKYDLVVKQEARISNSMAALTSKLPFKGECNPTALPKILTSLPPIYSDKQELVATWRLNDGVTSSLHASQTIAVCNQHYVEVEFCVNNLLPDFKLILKQEATGQETEVSTSCITINRKFDFTDHPGRFELRLSYSENAWCPRHGQFVIYFVETDIVCPPQACEEPEYTTCESHAGAQPRQPYKDEEFGMLLCDTVTDGGDWTVLQRRTNGETNFYRDHSDYVIGFGSHNQDFWIGLDIIHEFCFEAPYCTLRFDLKFNGTDYYAKYSQFYIEGESNHFRLHVSGYTGDAGDSFSYQDGSKFTTRNQDHDNNGQNCAVYNHGAWWYNNCHHTNLNGDWGNTDFGRGLNWRAVTGMRASVDFSEMKIRKN